MLVLKSYLELARKRLLDEKYKDFLIIRCSSR